MTGEHQITAPIWRFPCHRRTMIDSSGLGSLVRAFTSIHTQGGELKLLNLTNRVQDVVEITKLYTIFDIMNNEAVAIESFQSRGIAPIEFPTLSRRCLFNSHQL